MLKIDTVACIGCGVIGSAWAALFASHGLRVQACDPDPRASAQLERIVAQAAGALGAPARELLDRISLSPDLAAALQGAQFVQESAPDELTLKQRLYADLGRMVPAPVIIASSTSGFPMSQIQAYCPSPERTLVGHPINPPYAVPLVEVVGGALTSAEALDRACEFYRFLDREPLRLERETFGFVANRLQLALFREALQMVALGEATASQVDAALMHGIGPRWASVGVFGAFLLNLAEPDAQAWLAHFEKIGFGEASVHREGFASWGPDVRARVARQWAERVAEEGSEALRTRRDAEVLRITRR
jgi:carnitine 3-dehydrogenase